jgi:hypothetical protein
MPSPSGPMTQMNNLRRLGEILRENPDTGTGVQIRALLWSLLNQHHLVNLWSLCSRLNDEPARLAADVLTAALLGRLTDSQVKQTLIECGEMERWDRVNASDTVADVKSTLARALRATAPGLDHVRLAAALHELERG